MMDLHRTTIFGVFLMFMNCQDSDRTDSVKPPVAKTVPTRLAKHGHERIDPYYWLKERENPEVIEYLKAENQYTEAVMAHAEELYAKLFEEIKGRIKQTDISAPFKKGDYFYYQRFEEGKEYPIYCRKKGNLDTTEEVMLDVNELAKGHSFFSVGGQEVSSGQDILAYAADNVGRRFHTIYFKNLQSGELHPDVIHQVTANLAWANDNRTLFYSKQDPLTLRSYQIYRHRLGTEPSEDQLVYEEKDETFSCRVFKTRSQKFIMIASRQTLATEYRYLDADQPQGNFKVFLPRERNHEYHLDHYRDSFYIRTNRAARNFRLMKTSLSKTEEKDWLELIPHREDVLLQDIEIFKDHLVVQERKDGLAQLRIRPWAGGEEHYLDFGEPAYRAYVAQNPEIDRHTLRYGYTSLTTPNSIYDYNMVSREKVLVKREEILGGFEPENYQTERLQALARDGVRVPLSIVYRKGMRKDGSHPLLLYGYGSYGASLDAAFNTPLLSLLDRGFVYAIAHVRGGQELGRQWYENGKLLRKKNTFTDFIDCAEFLVGENYTSPERLFAKGGSAGGLLMGAVVNMRPDLFRAVIANVPFVDVMSTMLDESIPLTTSEYDEWGNPNQKEYYDYILSYSPYDNVEAKDYPNLLVTTGLHDSQVQYWEPAKWVARLRSLKTDNHRLILKTNMEAGHGGASGRYRRYQEIAFEYAFLLDLVAIKE